mgnify:CR=1 FL=1
MASAKGFGSAMRISRRSALGAGLAAASVAAAYAALGDPALTAQAAGVGSAADFKALFNAVRDHLATPRRPLRGA